jgi:regulatory protein
MTVPGGDGDDASSSARNRRRRPDPSPTQRALALLTRREHSRKELARKLMHRGVDAGEAQATIDRLAKDGWQNDARFAESLVRSRALAGYGPAFIRAELGTHGFGNDAVVSALDGFDGDWVDSARDLLRRRHPAARTGDREAQRKAADYLLRRGFGMEQVRHALRGGQDED